MSTQPVVKLCSVAAAGRLSPTGATRMLLSLLASHTVAGLSLSQTAHYRFCSTTDDYIYAIVSYSKSRTGSTHRLVNCLYRFGCYTAQSTYTCYIPYPALSACANHLSSVRFRSPSPIRSSLPTAGFSPLPSRQYSFLQLSLSLQDGQDSVPRGHLHTRLPHGAHSTKGYVSHLLPFRGANLFLGYRVWGLGYRVFLFPKP